MAEEKTGLRIRVEFDPTAQHEEFELDRNGIGLIRRGLAPVELGTAVDKLYFEGPVAEVVSTGLREGDKEDA